MTNEHPTSDELLDLALAAQNGAATTDSDGHSRSDGEDTTAAHARLAMHVEQCVACRVRLIRLQQAEGFDGPSEDALGRILTDAPALDDDARGFLTRADRTVPQPGEIWRVGTDNALLVWVRKVVNDTTIDVVPLVFDTAMADSESLLIDAEDTPLGVPLSALVSVRTHIHHDVFLNKLSVLDISGAVEAILVAARTGEEPTGLPTGPPIEDAADRRIEFRQLVADLLGELSPVVYNDRLKLQDDVAPTPGESTRLRIEGSVLEGSRHIADLRGFGDRVTGTGNPEGHAFELFDALREDLTVRLGQSITCVQLNPLTEPTEDGQYTALAKVHYIDTSVLVVLFEALLVEPSANGDASGLLPDPAQVPAGVASLLQVEVDAQGVAVTTRDMSNALLFTRADLRPALVLPAGTQSAASVTVTGHTLVDTLVKFLDGEPTAWETLDHDQARLPTFNFDQVARTYAAASLEAIRRTGTRSPQPAKKAAWSAMTADVVDDVSAFVEAARKDDISGAVEHLGLASE